MKKPLQIKDLQRFMLFGGVDVLPKNSKER